MDDAQPLDDAQLLDGARLLGAELDTRYRVLGLTVDVGAHRAVAVGVSREDPRVQVVLHPIGWFRAALLVDDPEDPRIEAFTVDQLVDVVHALDGPVLGEPVLDRADARDIVNAVPASLEGTTSTVDGRGRSALIDVSSGSRRLLLAVGYDELDRRDAGGNDLPAMTAQG